MINILIVDDSKLARKRITGILDDLSIECNILGLASNGIEALELYKQFELDVVITDIEMPGMDGLELISELRKINTSLDIIVISGLANEQIKQSLKSYSNVDFINKPIKTKVLELVLLKIENKLSKGIDT